ncbi:MAG: hypothetical protein KUL75_10855, partial [Sterolibacterium sp.]|nr:hypothetical protein [Sterolibacterium sp.]
LCVCDKHADHYFASELWRLRGEALAQLPGEQAQALHCLTQALDLAAAQGARTLELRAARSLLQYADLPRQRARLETRIAGILSDCPELAAAGVDWNVSCESSLRQARS